MTLIHGTGVLFDGKGVLIKGPSGSGKSDLALRLMTLGAQLIGDDYLEVTKNNNGRIVMAGPPNIAGLIEVRNVGILKGPYLATAEINLVLCLIAPEDKNCLERMPERKLIRLEGEAIPCLDFYAMAVSAPEKLRAALKIFS